MFRNIILAAALVLGISSVTPAVSVLNTHTDGTTDTVKIYASGEDTSGWFTLIQPIGYGSWGLGSTKAPVIGDSILVTFQIIGPVQAATDDSTNFTVALQTSEDKTVLSARDTTITTVVRASGGSSAAALYGFWLQPGDFTEAVPLAKYGRFIFMAGTDEQTNDTAYITDIRVRHLSTQFAQ